MEVLPKMEIFPKPIENLPADIAEVSNERERLTQIAGMIVADNELVVVGESETLYYRTPEQALFTRLEEAELRQWAWRTWYSAYGAFRPQDIDGVCRVVRLIIPKRIATMSKRYIMITNQLFWDRELGAIVTQPTEPVFYRFFNTKHSSKHVVQVPPFTAEQEQRLIAMYDTVYEELLLGKPDPERFGPLKVWANGSHDVYLDLHRAHAYSVLQKLPVGVYLAIGAAAGGKSSYAGMTTTIFGDEHTAKLGLSELGDWHGNLELDGKLVNVPDEDEDVTLTGQALFKSMADHGVVQLNVMREQKRAVIPCNFMCFVPMNHMPHWEGSGAEACMRRVLALPFNAKLIAMDKGKEQFAQETFTADFMCEYLGSMLAYARYYHVHNLEFSSTMEAFRQTIKEEVSNYELYLESFCRYFDGYTSVNLVYKDYQYWCMMRDLTFVKRRDFSFHLKQVFSKGKEGHKTIDGKDQRYIRDPKPHHHLFSEEFRPADLRDIKRVTATHEMHGSMVELLDLAYKTAGVLR